jgi:hypothetical protein
MFLSLPFEMLRSSGAEIRVKVVGNRIWCETRSSPTDGCTVPSTGYPPEDWNIDVRSFVDHEGTVVSISVSPAKQSHSALHDPFGMQLSPSVGGGLSG